MPSGNSKTGRKIPKTPGSRNEEEEIAGTGMPSSIGDPARITAVMRRQRIHQAYAIPANPTAHAIQSMSGSRFVLVAVSDGDGDGETTGFGSGSLTRSATVTKTEGVDTGAVRQPRLLPNATSKENGTRNFRDAATQIQWRTLAGFLRKISVSDPATPANRVDCHR